RATRPGAPVAAGGAASAGRASQSAGISRRKERRRIEADDTRHAACGRMVMQRGRSRIDRVSDLAAKPVDYLEGLMEGFVAYDGGWRMTYMNASAERILGRKREDVLGKTWHQAFPHAVGNPVDHMYQRVKSQRAAERMEYFYPHYKVWMEISASPLSNGGVGVYFRDITDRKNAEAELRESARRKDEFLATLAHELRNPLAPIANAVEVLNLQGADGAPSAARAVIGRQVKLMARLVEDLLDASRITSGKLELRRSR